MRPGEIIDVPLSNIYILHWSVNPTNPRLVEELSRADYDSIPPADGYIDHPPAFKGSYVKLTKQTRSKKYPKVYIHDGTHRARAAFLRWDREHHRRPTLKVLLEDPELR